MFQGPITLLNITFDNNTLIETNYDITTPVFAQKYVV